MVVVVETDALSGSVFGRTIGLSLDTTCSSVLSNDEEDREGDDSSFKSAWVNGNDMGSVMYVSMDDGVASVVVCVIDSVSL